MRLLLLFFTLWLPSYSAMPVEKAPVLDKQVLKSDSSWVIKRSFDQVQLKNYNKQSDFIYDKDTAPVSSNFWANFWRWFWKVINGVFDGSSSGTFAKYILMAVLIGCLVYGLMNLSGISFSVMTGKSKPIAIPYNESMDNIHELNFEEEIEHAVSGGNYRLAVRLFYLRALKNLNDQQQINWQPEKTNQTYLAEIQDPDRRKQFKQLTSQFEYIWYGEFYIDQNNYVRVKSAFDQFNLKQS